MSPFFASAFFTSVEESSMFFKSVAEGSVMKSPSAIFEAYVIRDFPREKAV